jgi:glycosyltransferase involved in cell wall biosynthesis
LKKEKDSVISVIVPIHIENEEIPEVRKSIFYATTPTEVIYVIEKNLSGIVENTKSFEKIIKIENKGRGFMLKEGVLNSSGDIILFLHSDTILPKGWDISIRNSLKDETVIGGGFKLKFNIESAYLDLVVKILTLRGEPAKILSGDRALFVRSYLIKNNLSTLDMPIMDDMELSYLMRNNGKVVILNKNVITSAHAFLKNGIFRQAIRIIISFIWYRIGGNLQDIYNYYYSNVK